MAQKSEEYSHSFRFWVESQLNQIVGISEFAPYLLSLNDSELKNYAREILGDTPTANSFITELIARRRRENEQRSTQPSSNHRSKKNESQQSSSKHRNNRPKSDETSMTIDADDYYSHLPTGSKKDKPRKSQQSQNNSNKTSKFRQAGGMTITRGEVSKKSSKSHSNTSNTSKNTSKRKRRVCGCQATVHNAFKNCTECGNILCVVEGEGPCFFCGSFVTLAGTVPVEDVDPSMMDDTASQSSKISSKSGSQSKESLKNAVDLKERLLKFGREKALRTRIVDDQGDYHETEATNMWLSDLERQRMAEKAKEQRRIMNQSRADEAIEISIDLESRSIMDVSETGKAKHIFETIDRDAQIAAQMQKEQEQSRNASSYYQNSALTGPASDVYASLRKLMEKDAESMTSHDEKKEEKKDDNVDRLQDGGYVERENKDIVDKKDIAFLKSKAQSRSKRKRLRKNVTYSDASDEGVCLSMHQPWASLLVLGIKMVEGRSWPTRYRGRLWIASARRQPTPFEIEQIENEYCEVYGLKRDQIPFPKEYPTAALLGCVDLVECLTKEDYTTKYVDSGLSTEHNSSAHCFVCQNPRRLLLAGAISGEHKLWRMPKERIRPMQSGLVPVDQSWQPIIDTKDDKSTDK